MIDLKKTIFENKYIYVDSWSILHLILFFIIGFYFPNEWLIIIIGSIIFEFSEGVVSKRLSRRTKFLKESMKDKISDLVINLIGYWLGINYGGIILGGII